ncbi:MAG TPA: CHASE2 domain-containing protein, partial [Opitutales bacterium]|nr:CHASE2 domain-containing protein [Opitutales bacterium]
MDWRFQFRGELTAPINVFYVDLDSFALNLIGERPWDRAFFADAASICFELGKAKAVGFDFIFSKAAKDSQLVSADKSASSDYALGRVVRLYSDKIVLGANYSDLRLEHMFDPSEGRGRYGDFPFIRDGNYDPKINPYPETPTFPIIGPSWGRLGLLSSDTQRDAGSVCRWIPLFAEFEGMADSMNILIGERDWLHLPVQSIQTEGASLVLKDKNGGTLDSMPKYTDRIFYNLAIELALAYYGLDDSAIQRTDTHLKILAEDATVLIDIPLTDKQDMQINWFSSWHNDELNPRCSMAQLYDHVSDYYQGTANEKEAARAFFEKINGAIVLIGPVDESLKDLAPTPFDAQPVPNVGIYGNALKTMFAGRYIYHVPYWAMVIITLSLTWVLATLGLYTGRNGVLMKSTVLAVFVGYILMVFVVFAHYEVVLPLVSPVGSAVTTAVLGLVLRIVQEERQKARVKDLFG